MVATQRLLLSLTRPAIEFLVLTLALLVPGCKTQVPPSAARQLQPAFNDSWTEKPIIRIPAGWVVVSASHSPDTSIKELVPTGQTADHWTDMMTLTISIKKEGQTLDSVLRLLSPAAQSGCGVRAASGVPSRFMDAGYPAAVSYELCRKTKREGVPEYFEVKVIEGDSGLYQILRSWRVPDYRPGEKLPITKAALEDGLRILDSAHVCDTGRGDRPCPPLLPFRP